LFSEDTKLNQILKAAMMHLLWQVDVKQDNKKALLKIAQVFLNHFFN
jgi:hypothetical protein